MKYAFIRSQEGRFALRTLCRVLHVSRSGYYEWRERPPSVRARTDAQLLVEIGRVHEAHLQAYGALKTWRALKVQGIACGKHRVAVGSKRRGQVLKYQFSYRRATGAKNRCPPPSRNPTGRLSRS